MTLYLDFKPAVKNSLKERGEDFCFIYNKDSILIVEKNNDIYLPRLEDIDSLNLTFNFKQDMGQYKGFNCTAFSTDDNLALENIYFMGLKEHSERVDERDFLLASKGRLLIDWFKNNQYCGFCGGRMIQKESFYERAMVCSNCQNTSWPRTSPAILVAVKRRDELLLCSNKLFPQGSYSFLAGFLDYGESFEDCVKREVYEEVGIEIENIKYFGSKPWPFPNSMMIAYIADYKSGDIILDEKELYDANWFKIDQLPDLFYNRNSIACDMIDYLKENI